MKTSTLHDAIYAAVLAAVAGTAHPAIAQDTATGTTWAPGGGLRSESDFNLPAGELATALEALGAQGGIELVYRPELVAGRQARAVSGRMGWRDALGRLLQGTGLAYRQVDGRTVVIEGPEAGAGPDGSPARARPQTASSEVAEMASITVTGTRIRGGTSPSPVITIGSERIREEGFTDLGEVIRSVPQNFTGGQNPGVLMGNVTGGGLANQNLTGGSGLNLRGLGPDASLTLLNGRRMSYGGFVQAVDISAIPVDAVERIEIVADGASAIYGSDAVGGVGNVILKRDFEGFTVGARYGAASDGGLTTREYTGTAGATWASGGLIATYKNASSDPIYAHQRDYTSHLPEPSTIYPGSDQRSGLLSVHQSVGDLIELRLDALHTERKQLYYYYFGSPNLYNKLTPESTTAFVSPGIEFSMPNDWSLSIGGAWGEDETMNRHRKVDAMTGISMPYLDECFCNKSRVYEIDAEGSVLKMSGGDARLAVGAGYRVNEFLWDNFITDHVTAYGSERSKFAYAELHLPLIGSESGISGVQRLEMTAAVRGEEYDSFGRIATPKLGLIYGPSANLTVKASWGRSFKAPTLFQRFNPSLAIAVSPGPYGGVGYAPDETVLGMAGGNPDLKPERAETWSASLALHPTSLRGLEAELTAFYIDYSDRAIQPINNYSEALSDPIYAEFVEFSPTPERVAELIAAAGTFINSTGASFDPSRVFAIFDARFVNATRQRIRGIDLSGSFRLHLGSSQMTIRGSSSWLDSTQQTIGMPAAYDLAGTLHNPAKINGRVGAVWDQGGFSASTFANYVSGVRNRSDGVKGASFTTVDATLRYDTGERGDAWSGLQFTLTASNLLDRRPPSYVPIAHAFVAPYDSTNYSAIGRFLSLSVSKHW